MNVETPVTDAILTGHRIVTVVFQAVDVRLGVVFCIASVGEPYRASVQVISCTPS